MLLLKYLTNAIFFKRISKSFNRLLQPFKWIYADYKQKSVWIRFPKGHIFNQGLPLSTYGSINQIWTVCALLVNFQNPIISVKRNILGLS